MNHLAQVKVALAERRAIIALINEMADKSDDPNCCKRFGKRIADAVKRGAHILEAA